MEEKLASYTTSDTSSFLESVARGLAMPDCRRSMQYGARELIMKIRALVDKLIDTDGNRDSALRLCFTIKTRKGTKKGRRYPQ